MRLIALDIETTGLDPQRDQIIELGMVCFESTTGEVVGEFETMVAHARYAGDAYALQMNAGLLKRLATEATVDNATWITDLPVAIRNALANWGFHSKNKPQVVGFNVAPFDLAFVIKAGFRGFHHRAVEVGSLLMTHPECRSDAAVTSNVAIKLLGENRIVEHTALADCYMAKELYMIAMGRSESV